VILDVAEDHVVVVSDLHIGSPASRAPDLLPGFLDYVTDIGAQLCINGDGFDILQSSFASLVGGSLPVVRKLRQLHALGRRIYYTLGNHDIAFEHLIADFPICVSPFLNLRSGDRLIRIEHGHVYEPFYARWPRAYELGGRLARPVLLARRDTYALWSRMQLAVDLHRRRDGDYPHHRAARALFSRGFDAVVFGHTHHPELTKFESGTFVNAGSWLTGGTWVDIDLGVASLHTWTSTAVDDVVGDRAPK
jgi:predicted phosphodiesterase